MQSRATTVPEYLASLPADRRHALEEIRMVMRKNIDRAFAEGMQYGMLGYYLPHTKYPAGYHCDPKQPLPFASVASQKNHIGLYLFCVYVDAEEQARFVEEWKATGKRLDMGKSCVRVKKLEDVPLDVLGRALKRMTAKRFVAAYEQSLEGTAAGKELAARKAQAAGSAPKPAAKKTTTSAAPTRKKASKAPAARKPAARKPVARKTAPKKKAARKASPR